MNALVVIDTLSPTIFSEEGGIDAMLASLEAKVRSVPTDISTPAGRAAIKSLAHQVARSKTAFDDMGKELVSDWKSKSKAVDKERARVWDRLEALQEEVRKPLTDWENAEKERIKRHETALGDLAFMTNFVAAVPEAWEIAIRIDELSKLPDRNWQEFAKRAADVRHEVSVKLGSMHTVALAREAEAAELARLRAEKVAREQKERDERIAAEAANQARLDAEAKAAREAQEASDAAAAEARRLESEKKSADDRAAKAERDAADAVERERQRVAAEAAAEAAAAEKREANKRHVRKINNEILDALLAAGLDQESAKMAITAIVRGDVPHTKITY